jgi:quercetin dioxygenase-like cupin family protein/SAM-dependent methyltransferase
MSERSPGADAGAAASKNFSRLSLDFSKLPPLTSPRRQLELEALGLGLIRLAPGQGTSFTHSHREQEEVYIVLEGRGRMWVSGEMLDLKAGDLVRVSAPARRALQASAEDSLLMICAGAVPAGYPHDPQARYLIDDGQPHYDDPPPWARDDPEALARNQALAERAARSKEKRESSQREAPNPRLKCLLRRLREGPSGPVLDLACGHGRNALWLAEHGFSVVALDRDPLALDAVQRAAGALDVTTLCCDLEVPNFSGPELASGRWAGVLVNRYLHRPLLPLLKASIRPGGWIFYETFHERQAELGRPKNPDFLLRDGELPELFSDFHIIEAWEGLQERPLPQFVAGIYARARGDLKSIECR